MHYQPAYVIMDISILYMDYIYLLSTHHPVIVWYYIAKEHSTSHNCYRIYSRILAPRVLEKYIHIFVSYKDILLLAKVIIYIASVLKRLSYDSSSHAIV